MEKPRILVVDDNKDVRNSVKAQFTSLGCDVFAAENGAEGLNALRENAVVHVIILDMRMPVMDGPTMYEKIVRNPETKNIPIVPFTSIKKDVNDGGVVLNWINASATGKEEGVDRLRFPIVSKSDPHEKNPYFDLILKVAKAVEKAGVPLPEELRRVVNIILRAQFRP